MSQITSNQSVLGVLQHAHVVAVCQPDERETTRPLQILDPLAVNQANFITTDILCNGAANGAFTVEFTGGNPPYQYSLNGGAYLTNGFTTTTASVTTGGASSTVVSYTTQVLSLNSLEGGTYSVKIKDSGLCTDSGGNLIELNLGY